MMPGDKPISRSRAVKRETVLVLSLAGGGVFRTLAPSLHARTQADVLRDFLGTETRMQAVGEKDWLVEVLPAAGAVHARRDG